MTDKPIEPCKVCTKKTRWECSHTDCPNRKPVTAAPPEDVDFFGHGRAIPSNKE